LARVSIYWVVFIALASTTSASPLNEYTVTIQQWPSMTVMIQTMLNVQGDTLYMHPGCPNNDYPDGWGTFIKELDIRDQKGKELSYLYLGKSRWKVNGLSLQSRILRIRYKVDLSFVNVHWDVGNEQSGYFDGKALYVCTRVLFVVANPDLPAQIHFQLPGGVRLSAPWKMNGGAYRAISREELFDNSLVVGEHSQHITTIRNIQFIIAALGDMKDAIVPLDSALSRVLRSYLEIFPDTSQRVYLITVFRSFQDDGEAYSSSTAFTLKDQVKEANKIIWVNQLAHELLHYWLGGELRMDGGDASRWFHEGFTEYFANLSLIRNGVISRKEFFHKVESMIGLYLLFKWSCPDTSLSVAGEKGGSMFRFGVYNGGWVTAFSLDMKLRAASHGSKRLDDVLGFLYQKYRNVPFSRKNFVSSLNSAAQGDYEEFLGQYVTGKETVPIMKFLPEAGLYGCYVDYQGEFYLQMVPGAESTQLLEAWIGSEGR